MPKQLRREEYFQCFQNLFNNDYPAVDEVQGNDVNFSISVIESAAAYLVEEGNDAEVEELSAYKGELLEVMSADPLVWWKNRTMRYPRLSKNGKGLSINTGNKCCVASERLFSFAGNVSTPARNRLADDTLEVLLSLRSWYHAGFE
ncbi:hypothetical protein RCL1_003057 [Eukaryota sp. TZLM3-RCL]